MRLTAKQMRFADEYILTGNVTESARRAGYKHPHVQGSQVLENLRVSEYIAERTKSVDVRKKMDLAEAIEIASSIARGEIQKSYSKKYDKLNGVVLNETEYEFSPSIEERQKSLEHIIKINGGFVDRKEITGALGLVQIVDDIPEDDEDEY